MNSPEKPVEICKDGYKSENLPVVENKGEKYFEGLGWRARITLNLALSNNTI
jgi:hypothetical protein